MLGSIFANYKIAYAIVLFIPIFVMYNLRWFKVPAQFLLHRESMLKNVSVIVGMRMIGLMDLPISNSGLASTAAPIRGFFRQCLFLVAGQRAEKQTSTGRSFVSFAAVFANSLASASAAFPRAKEFVSISLRLVVLVASLAGARYDSGIHVLKVNLWVMQNQL